jgi:ABC-type nitrate/sulfonate/bicarbonate transport system substrate-binding protein
MRTNPPNKETVSGRAQVAGSGFGVGLARLSGLLFWLLILAACGPSGGNPTGPEEVMPTGSSDAPVLRSSLQLAQLPITYSAVTHLADALGYFSEEGLDCQVVSVPAGPDVVTALRGQSASAADVGAIAVTPVITMIAAGADPVVIATTLRSDHQVAVVTFESSGISEDPATLRGKRVGVVRNTNGDIYLSRLLSRGGLTEQDITSVNGRPSDLKLLLLQGDLDAAVLWDPFVAQALREYGDRRASGGTQDRGEARALIDPSIHTLAFNVVTMSNKLASNREELVSFLRATIRAEDFISQDPVAAEELLRTWLGLVPGYLDNLMSTTQFHVYLDVPQMMQWMREELEWYRSEHPDTAIPEDLSPYIDSSLLREIDPSRVSE